MSFDAAKWNRFAKELTNLEDAHTKGHSDYFIVIQGRGPAGELLDVKCLSSNWLKRQCQRLTTWLKKPKNTELVYARAKSDNAANQLILSRLSEQIRTELRYCTLDEPQFLEHMRERHITAISDLIDPDTQEEILPELPVITNDESFSDLASFSHAEVLMDPTQQILEMQRLMTSSEQKLVSAQEALNLNQQQLDSLETARHQSEKQRVGKKAFSTDAPSSFEHAEQRLKLTQERLHFVTSFSEEIKQARTYAQWTFQAKKDFLRIEAQK